ncbi:homeobox protein cut-like [Trichonephila inaurata madagascariensis]|uniref:Homeobox protein cut-like n=1 Tax=Trichonephila inaurata madagascariensis TaxID=2747483 RepID=A0A8X6YU50_9ARAC|nr:homeobox protein cut-like [Trichonephila inaurata madagascariensis]
MTTAVSDSGVFWLLRISCNGSLNGVRQSFSAHRMKVGHSKICFGVNEVTIKLLREKVREFEDKEESTVQEKAEEKDPELLHLFDEKENDQLGSEFAIKSNLEEAETKVAQLQSALDRSQSELFDLKSRYDEDSNAK